MLTGGVMEEKNLNELREQAKVLAEKLSLDEKIGMIHGAQLFQTKGVERLQIPPLKMSDGPMGVRNEFEPDNWNVVGYTDDYVTYLPCNSALASTWNRDLAYDMGSVLGAEARGRGKDVILAPGINIKRSPLCGRNFEYFSEDPYLTGQLAIPFIKGVQEWDVAACVKHFAVNNQETERLWVDVKIDEEALRQIYLPAFKDAILEGDSYTIMGAYNKVNGEYCCESEYLLNDILRKEWGYEGVVISDWGAVHNSKQTANSQLDIEMSVTYNFDEYFMANPLKKLVEEGEVSETVIDQKVIRILMLMMRLHMFDGKRKSGTYNTEGHRRIALDIARESVVLLKNEQKNLPLSSDHMSKLLVIGENAECIHSNGGGSGEVKALYEISPLMGIKKLLGGNVQVDYVKGYCGDKNFENAENLEGEAVNWQKDSLEDGGGKTRQSQTDEAIRKKRAELREEAVLMAREYEHIIFVGGLNHEHDSEGNDRADMKLPYEQDQLLCELLAVNPQTVVAMVSGSPVEMGAWIENADSVVFSWYAGMESGTALAEILFGEINPSGKLPETFYKTHMDCSAHCVGEFPGGKEVNYQEGILVGYRYQDLYGAEPEFCFGHGLSYTDFRLDKGELLKVDVCYAVSCWVTNTGARMGAETIQVYLRKNEEDRQVMQELKGFEKVLLLAGESKCVTVKLEEYEEGMEIAIGSSSRDIRMVL